MAFEIKEKCAVAAAITSSEDINAAELVYESLIAMQHRGPEASGIVCESSTGDLQSKKGLGLVVDVFDKPARMRLIGNMAVGHNRYSTSGAKDSHVQPFEDPAIGFALSLNGNLPVTDRLEKFLSSKNIRTAYANDTEMAGLAISQFLREGLDLPQAIERAYPLMTGAFSCVAMHNSQLVAFRDAYGIRPLAIGKIDHGYSVASETCGLDINDSAYVREVDPGEMVIITNSELESQKIAIAESKLDIFEFVYFARHDSMLYGQRVNEVRRRSGEQLFKEHPPRQDKVDNLIIVPVPDTSIPAAEGYANQLGLNSTSAIIKNRYIGRTFMQPINSERNKNLRRKHNTIPEVIDGKDVILIDDSIVRLNTMPRLVELTYLSGARSVTVLIASPPVRFPDFYGIDTPDQIELAAANLTIEQMRQKMGEEKKCIYLGFLSLSGLIKATNLPDYMYNLSCFTGEYPIDIGDRKRDIFKPSDMSGVE